MMSIYPGNCPHRDHINRHAPDFECPSKLQPCPEPGPYSPDFLELCLHARYIHLQSVCSTLRILMQAEHEDLIAIHARTKQFTCCPGQERSYVSRIVAGGSSPFLIRLANASNIIHDIRHTTATPHTTPPHIFPYNRNPHHSPLPH